MVLARIKQSLQESKLIAHRGAAALAPENTLVSFQKAHDLGAKWVEFDVMLTADDVPIIMHDTTLDRTTNLSGLVAQKTYAEIKDLDAGSWFAPAFAGEPIPTFEALLKLLRDLDMRMEVEVKPTPGRGEETARATIEMLYKHWPMDTNPPLLSSWDFHSCTTINQIAPDLIVGSVVDSIEEIESALSSPVVSVNHKIITDEIFRELKDRFEIILPYTVNDRARAEELLDIGVDAVFSDYPNLLL